MIFGMRCWNSLPCDVDLSVEAVTAVGVALSVAVIALGMMALVGVLATRGR